MSDNGVKIGYWDTMQGPTPHMVGQIRGTPTIKYIAPKKKNKKNSNAKKKLSDYNGPREYQPMADFVSGMLPNFVTKINGAKDLEKFEDKADKYFLPKALLFTKSGSTSPLLKVLSTEFRRRLLVGEVRLSKPNQALVKRFQAVQDQLAASKGKKDINILLVLPAAGSENSDVVAFPADKKFSFKRATRFLAKHALKKPYFEDDVAQAKMAAAAADAGTEDGGAKSEL